MLKVDVGALNEEEKRKTFILRNQRNLHFILTFEEFVRVRIPQCSSFFITMNWVGEYIDKPERQTNEQTNGRQEVEGANFGRMGNRRCESVHV